MSQIVISNKEVMGLRKLPFVFTEQGVNIMLDDEFLILNEKKVA